eukprot:TRINITY_DN60769_c0_g1_i1.p1 TRINITY_DN60769_c0_g1~~TRINITY_DN60769_c0_g1_i1.p1  ORF type:complete len:123 (+),score=17.10 TRINITY_DN60769_c0_g1_i1:61-429(+)
MHCAPAVSLAILALVVPAAGTRPQTTETSHVMKNTDEAVKDKLSGSKKHGDKCTWYYLNQCGSGLSCKENRGMGIPDYVCLKAAGSVSVGEECFSIDECPDAIGGHLEPCDWNQDAGKFLCR